MATVVTPDLPGVARAFNEAGAEYVVIGGFALAALQYVRATDDSDLLIPDSEDNHARVFAALGALEAQPKSGQPLSEELVAGSEHLRLYSDSGKIDLLKEGAPPLDFETVRGESTVEDVAGVPIRFAGLASVVAFKRLAGRPRDRLDIEELELIHGPIPKIDIPGLDS
jgi:hypothetical protein